MYLYLYNLYLYVHMDIISNYMSSHVYICKDDRLHWEMNAEAVVPESALWMQNMQNGSTPLTILLLLKSWGGENPGSHEGMHCYHCRIY